MGSEHQKFRKGQRSISAKQMTALSRDAELAGKTKVKGGSQKKVVGTGQIIDTSISAKRDAAAWDISRTVVIKKSPSVNTGYVTVQAVRYSTWPIEPCDDGGCHIVAYGPEFEVRPEYGKKTEDYSAFEVRTDPIDTGTTFFRVRRENDAWILNTQGVSGGEVGLCLVHQPLAGTQWNVTPDPDFIRVVHMKENPAYTIGSGLPTHIWAGLGADATGSSIVKCWPGTKQSYWQYFLSTNAGYPPVALPNAVYMSTMMLDGVEYIAPMVAIAASTPNPSLPAGDC